MINGQCDKDNGGPSFDTALHSDLEWELHATQVYMRANQLELNRLAIAVSASFRPSRHSRCYKSILKSIKTIIFKYKNRIVLL